jgi:hypothetical protein
MKGHIRTLKTATIAMVATIAVAALLVGPSAVLAKGDVQAERATLRYTTTLEDAQSQSDAAPVATVKFEAPERKTETLSETNTRAAAEIPEPAVRVASGHTLTRTTTTSSGGSTTSSTGTSSGSELAQAQAILNGYIAKYPILAGTTVTIGQTPGGHQAVAYYTVGRILISPTHTASLERIIGHEIWHIIDYRDNGQIDWGENVPPANY